MRYVLVPLGNKGKEYELTRHNAGRLVVNELGSVEGFDVLVPSGYMNESGLDVAKYMRYHNDVMPIIVYDDKDLPLGVVKLAYDRGDGGHNGVKSVITCLGTKTFLRVRVGIGAHDASTAPIHGERVQSFVMGRFTEEELKVLRTESVEKAKLMLDTLLSSGVEKAMEKGNKN